MASNTNYNQMQTSSLINILKSKGINYSNKRKDELIKLCEGAQVLNLPSLTDNSNDYEASIARRTVKGKTYEHPTHEPSQLIWSNNLSYMPHIDAFDVTAFLQNWCGWPVERVQRRKSDNAYKLHCAGHVHEVVIANLGDDLFYLKGKCVPETKQSSSPYTPWILAEKSGHIISAECDCVAGDGSCKHVVALLFGLADHVTAMEDRTTIGVTDAAAYWDKPRKVCRPVDVHNLDVRTDMSIPDKARPSEDSGYLLLNPSSIDNREMEKDFMKILKESNTPAVALYTLSDSESEDSNDISMFVENYPPNFLDLIAKHGQENINTLKVEHMYISQVNELTKGQSSNLMWDYQRKGRLTASNFYNALHYRGDSIDNYIVKNVMGSYHFTAKSVEHGKNHEPIARGKYVKSMSRQHTSFQCLETGLHVCKMYPYLGASPDGICECKCCGKGLVEIKCPYSLRHEVPQIAMAKNSSCIFVNGKYELKKNMSSPYYVQMLGQMGICDFSFCDFVLCTEKDIYVERVQFSTENWGVLLEKLKSFYIKYVLPNLTL